MPVALCYFLGIEIRTQSSGDKADRFSNKHMCNNFGF